jgi:solute carrier family 25 aspartate/glutamate transporter 12/13
MTSWNSFAVAPQTIVLLTSFLFFLAVPCSHSFHIPDPIIHFSCGAVAGSAGAVAAYPFDYIKSQMQTAYGREKYENGLDALVDTVQRNPLHLYKGVGVQVLGIAPEKGIKLGVNDVLATIFYSSMGSFPLWGQIVSGGIAGACQVVASSPLEVMKVGLQTSDMSIQQVWEEVGGVKGLFRGAEACILRDVLFTAICFPLYAYWVQADVPSEFFSAPSLTA